MAWKRWLRDIPEPTALLHPSTCVSRRRGQWRVNGTCLHGRGPEVLIPLPACLPSRRSGTHPAVQAEGYPHKYEACLGRSQPPPPAQRAPHDPRQRQAHAEERHEPAQQHGALVRTLALIQPAGFCCALKAFGATHGSKLIGQAGAEHFARAIACAACECAGYFARVVQGVEGFHGCCGSLASFSSSE